MPFRKQKIGAVFDEFLRGILHPGERVEAATLAMRGLGYYWRGGGGHPVYVVVTNERVLFIDTTDLGIRPKQVYLRVARGSDAVVAMRRELDPSPLHLWTTRVTYRTPDGELLKLHFSSYWDEENRRCWRHCPPVGDLSMPRSSRIRAAGRMR